MVLTMMVGWSGFGSILQRMKREGMNRSGGGVCLPETELHHAWQQADGTRAQVESADGRRYRVLYSGMPGGSYGPDFRQAVLEREDGSELVGDVEIHVRAREWYAHGHAEDAQYNGVKLHGVWSARDGGGSVVNFAGLRVPQVGLSELHRRVRTKREAWDGLRDDCDVGVVLGERMVSQAGDEWFAGKVAMFGEEIKTFGADIALQLGLFEALGYSRNRWQFRTLGRRVPWPYLKREIMVNVGRGLTASEVSLPLLRWGSGWDARPDFAVAPALVGDAPVWNRASGMPANRPERRVAAAAELVSAWYSRGGPMAQAVDAVRRAERCSDLWKEVTPKGSGIGRSRAMEMTVNVLLPFVAAWARFGGDGVLYAKAVTLYETHPDVSENSVLRESVRYLRSRGVGIADCRGARLQHGAMHLYRSVLVRPRPTRQPGLLV